jgi:DNA-binding transcriptional LysR family regulator
VRLQLLEMNTLQQIDALLDHRLDLGIIRKRALPEALASQALFRDPLAVVMRGDHPALASLDPQHPALPLRLLAQEPFVTFDRSAGAGIHDHIIALCAAPASPAHRPGSREPSTIIGLVSAGLGVSILPASCDHIRVEGVRFVPLADRDAASDVHVAYRRDERSARVRASSNCCAQAPPSAESTGRRHRHRMRRTQPRQAPHQTEADQGQHRAERAPVQPCAV